MREEHTSPEQMVRSVSRDLLEAFQERFVYATRAELRYELVVVDRQVLAVSGDGTVHVPRRHDLFLRAYLNRFDCVMTRWIGFVFPERERDQMRELTLVGRKATLTMCDR